MAIGFGVGFAGAVLFAPDRKKERVEWPAGGVNSDPTAFDTDNNIMSSVKRALRSVQDQVNEAFEEAKKAQADTEREMRAKYERKVHRTVEVAADGGGGEARIKEKTVGHFRNGNSSEELHLYDSIHPVNFPTAVST